MGVESRFRIGELSRRSGISADLLRAWERRYGLLSPARSARGLRLYSEDVLRVRANAAPPPRPPLPRRAGPRRRRRS